MRLSVSVAIAIIGALWLESHGTAANRSAGKSPVIVELFTSQGCSSCPSADALVHKLAAERPEVIPLAYHVDYWNYLGWRDPFSAKSWTERQVKYVTVFRLSGAYTPQAVVNGGRQMVGSDERSLRATIREESLRIPEAWIELRTGGERVQIKASSKRSGLDVVLAIVEDGNVTPVARGENSGRSLRNDFVVRRMSRVGSLDRGTIDTEVSLAVDPAWRSHPLRAVAFAQDRDSLRIYGAASQMLTPRAAAQP